MHATVNVWQCYEKFITYVQRLKERRQLGSKHEVGLPVAEELDLSVVVVVEVVVVVVGVVVPLLV